MLTEVHRFSKGHANSVQDLCGLLPRLTWLASGSDDRTVSLWDTSTGERREVLRGYSSGVWGVGFNLTGDTLYTSSGPTWLTWDLNGDRRFVARSVDRRADQRCLQNVVSSPTGDAVAYLGRRPRRHRGGAPAVPRPRQGAFVR